MNIFEKLLLRNHLFIVNRMVHDLLIKMVHDINSLVNVDEEFYVIK